MRLNFAVMPTIGVMPKSNFGVVVMLPSAFADVKLMSGTSRNYEIFDPLDFLAEVTQHIRNIMS